MYYDTLKRLEKYKDHLKYNEAVLNTNLQFFFFFSQENKKKALKLLRKIFPRKMFSKFFIAGVLNLIGFNFGKEKV